ncbi:MAG: SCO family protein [Bacteroidia bacterium]|nr:SCO family protein [Bacteroidia bacterium]
MQAPQIAQIVSLMRKTQLFFISAFALVLFSCGTEPKKNAGLLPVIGERQLAPNGTDTIYHTVGNFSFTNQFGETVSEKNTSGKIYVADFFFASCQSICPIMSKRMGRLQDAFKSDPEFLILSHTVNPMNDTVEVLNEYGKKYGALKGKWNLLTGEKKKIYDIARDGYLVNALQDDGTPEGFLHSELFLLIDKQKRIRGMYDGTDSMQVEKLISDVKVLKTE